MPIVQDIVTLGKFGLSAVSAVSAVCGYLLNGGNSVSSVFFIFSGMFFLVSGACALNQVQEREFDRMIGRTKCRPLPCNRISGETALMFSSAMLLLGLFTISITGTVLSLVLGLLGILLYNGLYTCLKLKSTFSLSLGAVAGAIPPVIGAAAAPDLHQAPLVFAAILFVWQMPHGWLIQLRDSTETPGIHSSRWKQAIGIKGLERISAVWTIAFGLMTGTTAMFNLLALDHFREALFVPAFLVLGPAAALVFRFKRDTPAQMSLALERLLKAGMFAVMAIICLSAIRR